MNFMLFIIKNVLQRFAKNKNGKDSKECFYKKKNLELKKGFEALNPSFWSITPLMKLERNDAFQSFRVKQRTKRRT